MTIGDLTYRIQILREEIDYHRGREDLSEAAILRKVARCLTLIGYYNSCIAFSIATET
jgi:hypothetical protein